MTLKTLEDYKPIWVYLMFPHNKTQDSGLGFHRRVAVFSCHPIWWQLLSTCLTAGGVDFDPLVKIMSSGFLLCKVTFPPFCNNRYFVESYLETVNLVTYLTLIYH